MCLYCSFIFSLFCYEFFQPTNKKSLRVPTWTHMQISPIIPFLSLIITYLFYCYILLYQKTRYFILCPQFSQYQLVNYLLIQYFYKLTMRNLSTTRELWLLYQRPKQQWQLKGNFVSCLPSLKLSKSGSLRSAGSFETPFNFVLDDDECLLTQF